MPTPETLDNPTERRPGLFWAWVLIALMLGSGLRLYGLNDGSLWIDEMYTMRDAVDVFEDDRRPTRWVGYLPTAAVLSATGMNAPHITWENIETWREKGLEPWHIRLGPAILGILGIPLLALALRNATRDDTVAGVFALLLACAPWHLYWSQLGRYYTLKFIFVGLVFSWYYRGTRHGEKKYLFLAFAALFVAYLIHMPALGLGMVMLIDIGASYLRKNPIRLGRAGWIAGVATAVVAVGLFVVEKKFWPDHFTAFVEAPKGGQSPPLVFAGAFYMIQLPVLIASAAGVLALKRHGKTQDGIYWFTAGLLPIALMAGLSLVTFALARYAFDALFGFLVLTSFTVVYAWRAIQPSYGRALASLPCLLILASNALLVAQYHTTGNHLHRDWVSAFEYVQEHRQDGERVMSQRPEIASYYLGEIITQEPPGPRARFIADRYADGKPVWVVDLGSSSTKQMRWGLADFAELHGVFPIRVWQPYSELHVYRYIPRPREQWEPEERAAEQARAAESP